jgi:hypothetical protein
VLGLTDTAADNCRGRIRDRQRVRGLGAGARRLLLGLYAYVIPFTGINRAERMLREPFSGARDITCEG